MQKRLKVQTFTRGKGLARKITLFFEDLQLSEVIDD